MLVNATVALYNTVTMLPYDYTQIPLARASCKDVLEGIGAPTRGVARVKDQPQLDAILADLKSDKFSLLRILGNLAALASSVCYNVNCLMNNSEEASIAGTAQSVFNVLNIIDILESLHESGTSENSTGETTEAV